MTSTEAKVPKRTVQVQHVLYRSHEHVLRRRWRYALKRTSPKTENETHQKSPI